MQSIHSRAIVHSAEASKPVSKGATTMRITNVELSVQFEEYARNMVRRGIAASSNEFTLETWSPGDNWTRYRIEHNGYKVTGYLTRKEMYNYLVAVNTTLDSIVRGYFQYK